jgi:hypothetical protein
MRANQLPAPAPTPNPTELPLRFYQDHHCQVKQPNAGSHRVFRCTSLYFSVYFTWRVWVVEVASAAEMRGRQIGLDYGHHHGIGIGMAMMRRLM